MINDIFNILLPQCCLLFFIFLQLIMAIGSAPKYHKYAGTISLTGIFSSIVLLSTVQVEPQYFGLRNAVMSDSYTLLFHFIILLCGFFIVPLTKNLIKTIRINACTFQAMLLTALFGAMNIVSANDFLTLFISIELMAFPIYFMIAASKNYYSKEAAFKYLITNAIATGVFLFGVSYLYGITSSLDFSVIYETMLDKEPSLLYSFACIIIVLGLISKLAVFPFANWIIDVYKGSETSVLAFLSTIPKLAMFGIICRLLVFPLSNSLELPFAVAIISIITALWANIYAICEKNVKSIFACSSAANASYVLIVASLVSVYNLSTVIFYLICYVFMNIAVFAFLNITEHENVGFCLNDFQGLFRKNREITLAYVISVIALAGFPITSGFISKIYLLTAIAGSGLVFLPFLLALLILMVVALFYYLKLIVPLFDTNSESSLRLNSLFSQKLVLYITAAITVIIGIYPEKIIELCKFIAYNI